jgi:hypothetical protein
VYTLFIFKPIVDSSPRNYLTKWQDSFSKGRILFGRKFMYFSLILKEKKSSIKNAVDRTHIL